jgi:hypothetical protein
MKVSMKALLGAAFCLLLGAGTASAQSGPFGMGLLNTPELGEPTKMKDGPNFDWGGWMQIGWQEHNDGAFTGNGPFQNQNEAGNVNLNQLYTYVAKVADGSQGLDWGFRFDSMYGVDGNEGQSFGNVDADHWDYLNGFGGPGDPAPHGAYEIAFPQAYLEVAAGDLALKAGHFYTPIGYEVVTSPNNFFLSRQLTFYNSEPFTHTGFLFTHKTTERFTSTLGWTAGWDTGFKRFNDGSNLVNGFTWNFTDNITIYNYGAVGNFGWRGDGWINSTIVQLTWTERLTTVHQLDILDTNLRDPNTGAGAFFGGPIGASPVNGIAGDSTGWINYSFYKLTDKVTFGTRSELYKADGQSFWTNTAGINWKPHANLIFRPEVRRNSSNHPNDLFNQTIYGADMILTF